MSTIRGQTVNGKWVQSRAYKAWDNMLRRCYNDKCKEYPLYGGRGITVWPSWRESFDAFYADMGDPPEGLSLDREETDGNYTPFNCRWATPREQAQGRRKTTKLTHLGRTQCLADWAREYGLSVSVLSNRLKICGWDAERALTTPVSAKGVSL